MEHFLKKDFRKAQELLKEAGNVHGRAVTLLNQQDFSGSIEASQHSSELAIKSLFKMVGIDPPKNHDPGKSLIRVEDKLKILQVEEVEEGSGLERLKFLSNLLERFHQEGMYGYKGVPASKIFIERDSRYFIDCSLEIIIVCALILFLFGYRLRFLTKEEYKAIEALGKYFALKKQPKYN